MDVPRNVRFFINLSGLEAPDITLTDAAGQAVPLLIERAHPRAEVYWVTARAQLEPLTAYALSLSADRSWNQSFTTTSSSNDRPPEIGSLTLSAPAASPFCEPYDSVTVEIASFTDHGQPFNSGVLQVDLGDERGLFPLHALSPTRAATIGDGDAACFGASRVAGLSAGSKQKANLTFWDSTGHAAHLYDVELSPQRSRPGGCGGPSADSEGSESGAQPATTEAQTVGAEGMRTSAADGCALVVTRTRSDSLPSLLALLFMVRYARRQRATRGHPCKTTQ